MSAMYDSKDIDKLVQHMGRGMLLCVSHNLKEMYLMDYPEIINHRTNIPISFGDLIGLLMHESVCNIKLTRFRHNHKLGWEELGLDGINNDYFTLIQ